MGQYWKAITIKNGVTKRYESNYGLKLMETSWFLNGFVNGVMNTLKTPHLVAWVGDYAVEEESGAFSYDGVEENISSKTNGFFKYLVNHTKRQFLDLTKYYNRCCNISKRVNDECFMVPHPLPLLTAIGNDRGGGDFHSGLIGYDMVGYWAKDLIQLVDYGKLKKLNYNEFEVVFLEEPSE